MTGSGRTGTGDWVYRKNRAQILAASDLCWICGHHGARTCDHIIPPKLWPPGVPGVHGLGNLAPAHGTMGAGKAKVHNPCPTCGRMCNQSKGDRVASRPQSRNWNTGST